MYTVSAYVSPGGSCRYEEWFNGLEPQAAAKVKRATDRMEDGNLGDYKSVGDGVLERRVHYGPGYRIYFGRDGERLVVLLGGGTKRRQDADIRAAKRAWKEYKATKQD